MTNDNPRADRPGLSRRGLLKSVAVGAGAAIGSGAVTGFPTIWAQNIKDVTLVHIGGSYACIKEIGDQASKDLGFKIEMQVVDPDDPAQPCADPAEELRHQQYRQFHDAPTLWARAC